MENKKEHIMVVDDTSANLKLLKEMLQKLGFAVSVFRRGTDAIHSLTYQIPDLILMDINMPEMDGYETCKRIKSNESCADVPVIFVSALNEITDKVKAFQNGGVDYITKPFELEEVQERVYTHLKIRRLQKQVTDLNGKLRQRVSEQMEEIEIANKNLVKAQNATVLALAKLSECRDTDTGMHLERVGYFCECLAIALAKRPDFLHIDERFIKTIKNVAPLHDIGKVGIEDKILLKPGALTAEEFEIMKTHTILGAQTFLEVKEAMPDTPYVEMAYEVIRYHHEKYDGSGYPDHLAGEEIPLSAQIMAVADVYDALRSKRPYKEPLSKNQVREVILSSEGRHLSPLMVALFQECEEMFDQIYERLKDKNGFLREIR